MEKVLIWFQEYYSYILFGLEFIGAIVASIYAFIYKFKHKSLVSDFDKIDKINDSLLLEETALFNIPTWVHSANYLYPYHGDGEQRFAYVYAKYCEWVKKQPTDFLEGYLRGVVNGILSADDVPKIYKNTEKEVFNETSESKEEERPSRVFAYGKKDESN